MENPNKDPHVIDNESAGLTMNAAEQKVYDELQGNTKTDDDENVDLPSDKQVEEPKDGGDESLYAGKYKTVDELKKGITNIGSDLPDYILEGLSEDALEKHYKDLESKLGSKTKEPQGDEDKTGDKEVDEARATISDDLFAEAEAEFIDKSSLSSSMYDKLNKAGIPNHVVDKFIRSVEVERNAVANKIVEIAGGQDQFEAMRDWAENGGISEAELNSIGELPYEAMLGAIEGVKARFERANGGVAPTRINGSIQTTSDGAYRNQNDYILDVSDRRYGKDQKYTSKVDAKFKNSSFS